MRTAFYVHESKEWAEDHKSVKIMEYELIKKFSPMYLLIRAINKDEEIKIMKKLHENGRLIGDVASKPRIKYTTEFHMTTDSKLFPAREKWERKGFIRDPFGFWLNKEGEIGLPLIEGKMIYQFDPFYAAHVTGREWKRMDWHIKCPMPRYIMSAEIYSTELKSIRGSKVTFRDIARSTDERTAISCIMWDFPREGCTAPGFCLCDYDDHIAYPLHSYLNTLVFDSIARKTVSGTHLKKYIMLELPISDSCIRARLFIKFSASLSLSLPLFSTEWLIFRNRYNFSNNWTDFWAWSETLRLKYRAILDAIAFYSSGLDLEEVNCILSMDEKDPRGFFRMDKDLEKEFRYPAIVAGAFSDLVEEFDGNIDRFMESWQLPENALKHRDAIRGIEWRKWNPGDTLSWEADALAKNEGIPWINYKRESEPEISTDKPMIPRRALHIHRDRLAKFLIDARKMGFKSEVTERYDRLWSEVWARDPDKTVLTWRDCEEYARCVLSLVKPEGAYERLKDVISGTKPYRYIYDPDFEEKMKMWENDEGKGGKPSKSASNKQPSCSLVGYMEGST